MNEAFSTNGSGEYVVRGPRRFPLNRHRPDVANYIAVGSQRVLFAEIHHEFSNSRHGRTLGAEVRFSPYRPATVTKPEWVGLLGLDANNLEHHQVMGELTAAFLRRSPTDQFDNREQQLLGLTAYTHDWGEAVHPDKPYHLKTVEDEVLEMAALAGIAAELYYDDPELARTIVMVSETVLCDRESKLGKAFNTVERMGYLRTALRARSAFNLAVAQGSEGLAPYLTSINQMTHMVVGGHLPALIERRLEFPALIDFLSGQQKPISEALAALPAASTLGYEQDNVARYQADFAQSQEAWSKISGELLK